MSNQCGCPRPAHIRNAPSIQDDAGDTGCCVVFVAVVLVGFLVLAILIGVSLWLGMRDLQHGGDWPASIWAEVTT